MNPDEPNSALAQALAQRELLGIEAARRAALGSLGRGNLLLAALLFVEDSGDQVSRELRPWRFGHPS